MPGNADPSFVFAQTFTRIKLKFFPLHVTNNAISFRDRKRDGTRRKSDDVLKKRFIDALVTRGSCRRPLRNITRAKCWADVTHSARTNLDGLRNARHWFCTRIPGNASQDFHSGLSGERYRRVLPLRALKTLLESGILRSWDESYLARTSCCCDSDNAQRNSTRICEQRFSRDLTTAPIY